MKKSMILLGMLSIGYAYAQSTDPYEGKVGINTNEPKATLDITPEANNLTGTTNEGIIAPRLSKTRIANIEASKLTEGTLVYATDNATSPISAYTGNDVKVSKITEKGYYFYNGTEWVKVQYKDTNDAEWVYDDTTKRINLKRSGQTTGFGNKVYYDAQTGQFFNKKEDTIENVSYAGITSARNIDGAGKYIIIQSNTDKITANSGEKQLSENILYVNEKANISNFSVKGNTTEVVIPSTNGAATIGVFANISNVLKNDNSSTNHIMGARNMSAIHKGSITNYITGSNSSVNLNTIGDIEYASGSRSQLDINRNTKSLKIGSAGLFSVMIDNSSATIEKIAGVDIKNSYGGRIQDPNITNVYGVYYDGLRNLGPDGLFRPKNVVNHYGIYLNGVEYAQNNYAIYTNEGKIRVGDLADTSATADRVVTVDANGVLKTGGSIASNNGVQNETGMTCTAANAGKINYTTIQKDGKDVGVFGFCMQKGTDYVWAYMLGGSNIYGTSANGAAFGQGL